MRQRFELKFFVCFFSSFIFLFDHEPNVRSTLSLYPTFNAFDLRAQPLRGNLCRPSHIVVSPGIAQVDTTVSLAMETSNNLMKELMYLSRILPLSTLHHYSSPWNLGGCETKALNHTNATASSQATCVLAFNLSR